MYSEKKEPKNWKNMDIIKKIHEDNQENINNDFTYWRRISNSEPKPAWWQLYASTAIFAFYYGFFFYNEQIEDTIKLKHI